MAELVKYLSIVYELFCELNYSFNAYSWFPVAQIAMPRSWDQIYLPSAWM